MYWRLSWSIRCSRKWHNYCSIRPQSMVLLTAVLFSGKHYLTVPLSTSKRWQPGNDSCWTRIVLANVCLPYPTSRTRLHWTVLQDVWLLPFNKDPVPCNYSVTYEIWRKYLILNCCSFNKFNIKFLSLANKLHNITQKLGDIIMSPSGNNKETNYPTTAIQQNPASQTNNK